MNSLQNSPNMQQNYLLQWWTIKHIIFSRRQNIENGYCCRNILLSKDNILEVVPLNAVQDAYIQSDVLDLVLISTF